MNKTKMRYSVKRTAWALLALAAISATMLAAIGAGPDDARASSVNSDWEIFEGHAYADHRAAPAGVSLIACLGGCDEGYVSAAVVTGEDGIYRVKVEPGQVRPDGRVVTFWLVNGEERVEADQDVLFRGNGEIRVLDLNFQDLPPDTIIASAPQPDSGGFTTDLTVPSANELGLVPAGSPQSYVNGISYGGMPLLPGFVIVLGMLLAAIGVSLLIYRRRLTW